MRRPKDPKDKNAPEDRQPPGGRAWQRVKDFERARGLPTQSTPAGESSGPEHDGPPSDTTKNRDT
jgi:hypothetical protein